MQRIEYSRPEVTELRVVTAEVLATSNLEDPTDGEEWGWD